MLPEVIPGAFSLAERRRGWLLGSKWALTQNLWWGGERNSSNLRKMPDPQAGGGPSGSKAQGELVLSSCFHQALSAPGALIPQAEPTLLGPKEACAELGWKEGYSILHQKKRTNI